MHIIRIQAQKSQEMRETSATLVSTSISFGDRCLERTFLEWWVYIFPLLNWQAQLGFLVCHSVQGECTDLALLGNQICTTVPPNVFHSVEMGCDFWNSLVARWADVEIQITLHPP